MITANPLPYEQERVSELLRYEILDTENETDFDDIVQLASLLCQSEIALISLIDDHRQWFKAKIGLKVDETPKEIAFCSHAIHQDDVFEISDASQDERFHDNPLVTGYPKIRFYAGQPLNSEQGYKLGTLCIIGTQPRKLGEKEHYILKILARQVEKQLELRLKIKQLEESLNLIDKQKNDLTAINILQAQVLSVLSHDLRSPLASLENILQIFDYNILEPQDIGKLIQEVRPNIDQTIYQLEDVLSWVQEQINGQKTNWQTFLMDTVAEKSLNWVKENAKQKGVNLIKKVEQNLQVFADDYLVEIILRNLLANAVKFSRKDDTVTLFAYQELDHICIGVQDTGIGIAKNNIEKILNGNGNFSSLGTAREKGTGLGLILCQTYLTNMNSQLKVVSEENQGCTFSFILTKN